MKQLRRLFESPQDSDATQPTQSVSAPDSNIGATEHQIKIQLDRGARVMTEVSDVTPAEIRSKFVIQGVGITGIGITPREKYGPQSVGVGDVVLQEVESWQFKDGECVAALRFISTKPSDVPEKGPAAAIEQDRVEGIQGG